MAHAVDAGRVILAFLFMAAGAVRRRHVFVMLHFLDAVMAVNAVQLAVDGLCKTVRREQRHRLGVAVDHALVRRVSVAVETIRVLQLFRREERGRGQHKDEGEKKSAAYWVMRCICHTR